MSENKKYFYLKLKDSFFSSEEMLMLESVPDGLIYQNIYLRLCLLSLKKEGALTFKDMIPYDVQMLSTVLHIDLAKMKLAVELFERLGLVTKTDNETLYMTDIQALIGQSSTEAERIAKYRKRIADSNNGTQALEDKGCTKSVQMLQSCTPEIEIELKTKTKTKQELEENRQEQNNTSIPAKPKTDFQIVIESYFQNYKNLYEQKAVLTEKPIINMKQAGKMIKDLLPVFGKDKILSALDKALLDNWIVGQGYSLTTILSSNQLNKLINSKGVPARQNYNCVHEFDDKIMLEEM